MCCVVLRCCLGCVAMHCGVGACAHLVAGMARGVRRRGLDTPRIGIEPGSTLGAYMGTEPALLPHVPRKTHTEKTQKQTEKDMALFKHIALV